MTESESREIKPKAKAEAAVPAEQTRPGLIFTPAVDIFENDKEITVLADMPGVQSRDLNIDLRENVLTLQGQVVPPEGDKEVDVFREYRTGGYSRAFTLSQVIDQSKINAEMKDGVLRITLPKVAAATPRKIEVRAA